VPANEPMKLVGLVEFDDKMKRMIGLATPPEIDRAFMQGGFVFERAIKQNIRKQQLIDTGNMRASIRAVLVKRATVVVGTHVVYAAIHEFGGTIRAKNAPFLVFKMGNQWVRVKSVNIPARPYMRPAFDKNHKKVVDTIGKELRHGIYRIV